MKLPDNKMERRLRISGVLIILGLIVELISLKWSHPTSFLFFIFVGGLLITAGMLFYLFSLVTAEIKTKEGIDKEASYDLAHQNGS